MSSNITSRVDDIALEIVDELEKALHQDDLAPFSLEQRQRLAQIIGDVIQRDRTFTLYERVNARGVLELLSAIMDGQTSDFIYRYRDVDRLEDDLRYLRYEGLVSIAYDDLDSINITPLGRAVVEVSRATDEIVAELPLLFEGRQFSPDCTRISQVALSSATVRDIDDLVAEPIAFDVVSEAAPEFVLIHALGGFVGDYEFNFTHEPMPLEENALVFPMLDPRMTLYRIAPSGPRPSRVQECEFLDEDDDGGIGLNARIGADLASGWYLVRLGAFGGTSGAGTLSVTRN